MKYRTVEGEATVRFTVRLPVGEGYGPVATEDPAVEAVLVALGNSCQVSLWGEDLEPAAVDMDLQEEDVELERDVDPELAQEAGR